MPTLMDMLVGKLALRRDMLSAASLRDCMSEQHGQPTLPLGQIMLRRRLVASGQLGELVRGAERAELACHRCQGMFAPMALDPNGGLACPRCGAALQIMFEGQAVSDRLATGNTVRMKQGFGGPGGFMDPHPSSRKLHTRRDSSTTSGTRKFRGSITRGDFSGGFGNYEIVEELGRGGMGVVYKARQPHLDRFVALKILLAGELASSKQVKRFQREAEIAARLKHPNIVQVHDVGQVGDYFYFTMDYIEGQPLNKLIKQRKLGIRRAVEVALDVARGLDHAHQRGAIHRDIKPANLIVDSDGHGVITDFGLARDMDPNALSQLTRSGAAVGTPYYMSPEQAQGQRDKISGSTDVYSLGVVMFESLTFELPFNAETQLELTTKILSEEPPRPASIEPAIDRDVETIVLKAMAKHPADRYASAGALADDLERYLRGEAIQARRAGPLAALGRVLRRNWRGIGVAALALTCVALGTFAIVRELDRRSDPDASPLPTATTSPIAAVTPPPLGLPAQAAARAREELEAAALSPHRQDYRSLLQRALPTLREAIDLDPQNLSLRLLRGRTLQRLRDREQAAADYRAVIAADPRGPAGAEASFRLAGMLSDAAMTVEDAEQAAIPVLEAGLANADPKTAGVWRELIKASLALQREDEPRSAQIALSMARDLAPNLPEVHLLRATAFLAQREMEQSLESYQRAVDLDSKNAQAWAGLGQVRAILGDAERAVDDELERALELDPLLEPALLLRAQINQARKQYRRAIADMRLVLDQNPDNFELLLFLSQLYDLDDRPADSDRMLQRASKIDPEDPRAYVLRANRYLKRPDFEGAIRELNRGVVELWLVPDARKQLLDASRVMTHGAGYLELQSALADKLEKRYPGDLDARVVRGEYFLQAEKIEEGYAEIDAILSQDPKHRGARDLELLAARLTMEPEEIRELILAFRRDFEGDVAATGFLCRIYAVLLDDFATANELGQRVLAEDPDNMDALVMMGLLALKSDNFSLGARLLEHASELSPTDAEALGLTGHAFRELKRPREAEEYFRRSMSSDPFRIDTLQGLVGLYMSTRRPERAEAAVEAFFKVHQLTEQPIPPPAAMLLADIAARQGDHARAIAIVENVDESVPDEPQIKYALGKLYAESGQLDKARETLDALLELDPTHERGRRIREQIGD